MAKEVKVYTTPTCPWCKRAKQFLKDNNVPFQEVDVATDRDAAAAIFAKSGQLGVPITEIDGDVVVGFDEPKLRDKLGLAKKA